MGALIFSGLRGILETFSKLRRSAGLALLLFSCPLLELAEEEGGTLPVSEAWLRARFVGLLGEVRVREDGRDCGALDRLEERSASFALGGNGTARGEGVWGGLLLGVPVNMVAD
jgi:hypothetical protein